jgi:hypothetical protein
MAVFHSKVLRPADSTAWLSEDFNLGIDMAIIEQCRIYFHLLVLPSLDICGGGAPDFAVHRATVRPVVETLVIWGPAGATVSTDVPLWVVFDWAAIPKFKHGQHNDDKHAHNDDASSDLADQ